MKPISKESNNSITLDEIELRVVKEFLDILILFELKEHKELSGYDLAVLQNQKFKISLSPGTVYATLYAMERRGLIMGRKQYLY
jgi:DNA-binding PadR family transcriptional regulator